MPGVQINPSTNKIKYNSVTGKVQTVGLVYPIPCPGECCCNAEDWPDSVYLHLSDITMPSGCCRWNNTNYGTNWSFPDPNSGHLLPLFGTCNFRKVLSEDGSYDEHGGNPNCENPFVIEFTDRLCFLTLVIDATSIRCNYNCGSQNIFRGSRPHVVDCETTIADLWGGGSISFTNSTPHWQAGCGPGGTAILSLGSEV